MTEAWQKFFCAACQRERPIAERVKVRTLWRCTGCANKTRFIKPEKAPAVDHEPYEREPIPDEVIEAYRESVE